MKELTSEACSLEAVELCKLNAIRLMGDSRNTSPPTRTALLELSIEECGKGLIVLMHFFKNNLTRSSSSLEVKRSPETEKTIQFVGGILKALPKGFDDIMSEETLREAFYDHTVKLKAVSAIVEMFGRIAANFDIQAMMEFYGNLERQAPNAVRKLQPEPKLQNATEILKKMRPEGQNASEAFKEILNELEVIDSDMFSNLDSIKKTGFFVNYDKELGSFLFSAGLSDGDCKRLENIISFLIQTIDVFERIPQLLKGLEGGENARRSRT